MLNAIKRAKKSCIRIQNLFVYISVTVYHKFLAKLYFLHHFLSRDLKSAYNILRSFVKIRQKIIAQMSGSLSTRRVCFYNKELKFARNCKRYKGMRCFVLCLSKIIAPVIQDC